MTLSELKTIWQDNPETHEHIKDLFTQLVNQDEQLCAHRDFVEKNAFGFGERCFQYFWDMLVQEMPEGFTFCEVGVFRFQIVSLIQLLSDRQGKIVDRYCVTPLSQIGIGWESDYKADGERIHNEFNLPKDYIIYQGLSTNPDIIEQAYISSPYDIVYIDGSHEKVDVDSDLKHYTPLVRKGGYLVVDDGACRMNMKWGNFQGIADVCDALATWEQSEMAKDFEFQFNVVHLMCYKRK